LRIAPDEFLKILREDLRSGRYAEGSALPTLREFEKQYGLHRDTTNRILAVLEGEGLIDRDGRRRYPAALRHRSEDRVFAVEHVFRRGEHPFFGALSDGVDDEFLSREYGVHLFTHREPGKSKLSSGTVMSALLERGILRGVLVAHCDLPPDDVQAFRRGGVAVWSLGVEPGPGVILFDVEHAALQGTHHMAKLGFDCIGLVCARRITGGMDIKGYHRALALDELASCEDDIIECTGFLDEAMETDADHSLPFEEFLRRRLKPIIEAGRRAVLRRIGAGNFPRALYISDEFLAIGAVRALQEMGLRTPQDVAVVSHMSSGNWAVELTGLTTTQFNGYLCGIEAARFMIDVAEGRRSTDDRLVLQARLVRGMSCGELDVADKDEAPIEVTP
jgi:DNA-binding LacI/PurR family transcriptional regulator